MFYYSNFLNLTRRSLVVATVFFAAGSVLAFQPVRYAPMDLYIQKPMPGGPKSVRVLDPEGAVLSSARFEYNGAGQLVAERFMNASGEATGQTRYVYEDQRIKEEQTIDAAGKLIGRTAFVYDRKDVLVRLEQFDAERRLVMSHNYRYKDGRIVEGVEVAGEAKDQFFLDYADDRLVSVTVKNNEHGQLSRIVYRYDEAGRLKQRVRESFGNRSRCDYLYDAQGRIQAYAYYNEINGRWEREKKLQFEY